MCTVVLSRQFVVFHCYQLGSMQGAGPECWGVLTCAFCKVFPAEMPPQRGVANQSVTAGDTCKGTRPSIICSGMCQARGLGCCCVAVLCFSAKVGCPTIVTAGWESDRHWQYVSMGFCLEHGGRGAMCLVHCSQCRQVGTRAHGGWVVSAAVQIPRALSLRGCAASSSPGANLGG